MAAVEYMHADTHGSLHMPCLLYVACWIRAVCSGLNYVFCFLSRMGFTVTICFIQNILLQDLIFIDVPVFPLMKFVIGLPFESHFGCLSSSKYFRSWLPQPPRKWILFRMRAAISCNSSRLLPSAVSEVYVFIK